MSSDLASDGGTACRWPTAGDYDVLVVDRMLPKRDGLSVIGTFAATRQPHAGADSVLHSDRSTTASGPARRRDDYLPKTTIHWPNCLSRV